MVEVSINLLAVVAATLVSMVLGMLWYSNFLFGKIWIKTMGKSEKEMKKENMTKVMILNLIATLVMAYVLAHFIDYTEAKDFLSGVQTGFWLWLGFVATSVLLVYLYEGRPKMLYYIYSGYQLVSLLLMGGLIAYLG